MSFGIELQNSFFSISQSIHANFNDLNHCNIGRPAVGYQSMFMKKMISNEPYYSTSLLQRLQFLSKPQITRRSDAEEKEGKEEKEQMLKDPTAVKLELQSK